MGEKTKSKIIYLLIIPLIISVVSGNFDRVVLLEKRNPNYFNFLGSQKLIESVSADPRNDNLAVFNPASYDDGELFFNTTADGIINIHGISRSEDKTFFISPTQFKLFNGEYDLYTDANPIDPVVLYMWATSIDGKGEFLATSNGNTHFAIDNKKYSSYFLAVYLPAMRECDEQFSVRITPSNFDKKTRQNDKHFDDLHYLTVEISLNELNTISKSDLYIFYNALKFQYAKYNWVSLIFSDGSGMQFVKGNSYGIYGEVDDLGCIKDQALEKQMDFNEIYNLIEEKCIC